MRVQGYPGAGGLVYSLLICSEESLGFNKASCCTNQRQHRTGLASTPPPTSSQTVGHRRAPLPREWAAVVSELKKRPRPRSPSFTMPVAVMNTLAGLMSTGEGHDGWCQIGGGEGQEGGGLGWVQRRVL